MAFGSVFKPLLISINYSLSEDQQKSSTSGRNPTGSKEAPTGGELIDLDSFPVLNASVSYSELQEQSMSMEAIIIQFAKDCGKDQICLSKAVLEVQLQVFWLMHI